MVSNHLWNHLREYYYSGNVFALFFFALNFYYNLILIFWFSHLWHFFMKFERDVKIVWIKFVNNLAISFQSVKMIDSWESANEKSVFFWHCTSIEPNQIERERRLEWETENKNETFFLMFCLQCSIINHNNRCNHLIHAV